MSLRILWEFHFLRTAPTTPSQALFLNDLESYQRRAIASSFMAGALRSSISMAVAWTRCSRRRSRQRGARLHNPSAAVPALSSGVLLGDNVHDLSAGWIDDQNIVALTLTNLKSFNRPI